MTRLHVRQSGRWAALFITLLAVYLRLHGLEAFVTNIDHAYPIAQAIDMVERGRWPLIGQYSSLLFDNPVGMAYILLLPWLLLRHVWGMHYVVALLNSLAVPLLYATVRQMVNEKSALVAAFLLAVNPWIILHSQGTWVQGLLVVLVTATFAFLIRAVAATHSPRSGWLLAALVSLTLLTQTYLLAFLSLAQVTPILWLNRRRLARRELLVGVLLFAAVTGFYGLQITLRWPTQSAKVESFLSESADLAWQTTALEHALRYITGHTYEVVYANDGTSLGQVRSQITAALTLFLTGAVFIGFIRALLHWWQRPRTRPFWSAVLLWWLIPILLLSFTSRPIHIHYLLLTVPAGFIIVGALLSPLAQRWWGLALALLIAGNAFWLLDTRSTIVSRQPANGALDQLSVGAIPAFAAVAQEVVDRDNLTELYAPLQPASLSAAAGRSLAVVNWFDVPGRVIFPIGRPAVYVRLQHSAPADPIPLAERVGLLAYPGHDFITFDRIPGYSRDELSHLPQHRVEWPSAEGLTLVGYDITAEACRLTVYWVVDALADGRFDWIYTPYAHLLDDVGGMVANLGAPGVEGGYYRLGDVYVYALEMPSLAGGRYRLRLGLVDGVHGGRGITFLLPADSPQPFYTTTITLP